jgi:hypothetical protein
MVSLAGNIAHAVLPYLPRIVVQIGAAAVPPIALLAAVHGIALAVRAGASGRVYYWAVGATALIGVGAFGLSFIALRDLMLAIGYSAATACAFPAIIDTAVAVATVMVVALGDKPVRRNRTATTFVSAQSPVVRWRAQSAKPHVNAAAPSNARAHAVSHSRAQHFGAVQGSPAQIGQSAHNAATQDDAELAADLIASGATTRSVDTVVAVLSAHRDGASINAAANASGINYRTAQRIMQAAAEHQQRQLVAVG